MSTTHIKTEPNEFARFHKMLIDAGIEPSYLKLSPQSKDPIPGVSWKKNLVTFRVAMKWLSQGGNVGIAGTPKDGMCIIDNDDPARVTDVKLTLTCTSRTRMGTHTFYITNDVPATSIHDDTAKMNISTNEYGEMRNLYQYVVCAGSYVPCTQKEYELIPDAEKHNAGRYSITDERPLSSITYDEIPQVFKDCIEHQRDIDNAKVAKKHIDAERPRTNNKHSQSALYDLSMGDVLNVNPNGIIRFPSPFHGSDTGKNTSLMERGSLVNCWRHNVTHTPLTALAILAGVGSCNELGYGHNGHGVSGLDMDDGETVYTMWTYAKDNGIIPKDDPIPTKALVWWGINKGLCKKSDLTDGWKIPPNKYKLIMVMMGLAGIKHGRRVKAGV